MDVPSYDVEFAGSRGREIRVVAGSEGIWRWRFCCGAQPIGADGSLQLFCEVPKFWLATCAQSETPDAPGFVRVLGSSDLTFDLTGIQRDWKALAWATIALPHGMQCGQRVTVEFGSAQFPCHCIAHKYESAPLTWRVGYDASGVRLRLWPPMVIHVIPGPLERSRTQRGCRW